MQESENCHDLNFPAPCFTVGLDHCGIMFLPCLSPDIHPSVRDTNLSLGLISKLTFFIIRCEIIVFLSPRQVFVRPEKWFRNRSSSSERLQDSLLLTGRLLMGSCVVYLLKSMLFFLTGVLPVCALDTTDPLKIQILVKCAAPLVTHRATM